MGEKTEVRLGEPQQAGPGVSPSALVVPVGPRVNNGKCKAAPSSGPIRRVCRRLSPVRSVAEAGLSRSHVFSPVSRHPLPVIGVLQARFEEVQAEAARWRLEAEELQWERAQGYMLAQEREEELDQLARVAGLGEAAGPTVITAVEIDALAQGLREAYELEGWQHEWLLHEVAGAHNNALTWAWEHRLLLNGLSSGVSYVMEEAASAALPPELVQGVARLGQLMAVHCHRNLLDPGSWLEAFMDGLQDSPSEEEIVEII
ncbi:hypothetical protein C0992_001693 [Termitomyces sp. T32_za158]|nr:hypothetical protein C0992_001693 [Termitomyces sp. T32_za158]